MKFTASLITFALALTATSSPTPAKRDLASIQAAFATISTTVVNLDNAILAYTGGDTAALDSASDAIVVATNDATDVANASGNLSDLDALNLISPIQALTAKINTSIDHLINVKPLIVAADSVAVTLASLNEQKAAAALLADAVTAKVPAGLRAIAASLAAGITTAIQRGITAYS